MNALQRRLIIERDGRECVYCHGTCPFQKGEKCNLPAKSLTAGAYWKLDSLRSPLGRLQVDHVDGKKHEDWNRVASLCPCCHSKKVQGGGAVYDAEVAYLLTVGDEPEEYRLAREQESADKPVRKATRKAKAKAHRKAQKAKLEKSRTSPRGMSTKSPVSGHEDTEKKPSRFGKKKEAQKARASLAIPMRYSSLPSKIQEQRNRPNYNTFHN
jgi:hypothetical protein